MPKLVYQDSSGARGSVELGSEIIMIGRANDCQIQTQDGLVSRRHAKVVYDGSYWIEDNGSANGVYVGQEKVQRYKLKPGDTFRCGHLEVRFEAEDTGRSSGSTAPAGIAPMPPPPVAKTTPPPAPPLIKPPASTVSAPPPPLIGVNDPSGAMGGGLTNKLPANMSGIVRPPPPPPGVVKPPSTAASSVAGAPPPPPGPAAQEAVPAAAAPVPNAELAALRSELEGERKRRAEAETERDAAKRRADETQRKLDELAAKPSDSDSERLQRRIEQLESELRRKGGAAATSDAQRAVEAERDRLRARVAELEAQGAAQTTAQAATATASAAASARIAELEAQAHKLGEERDAALQKAAADGQKGQGEELERAKRRIEQLESEARRRPVGAVSDDKRIEAQRAEMEAALRQLRDTERERDSLREQVARSSGPAKPPQPLIDSLTTISDGLADMRAALRAAGDDLAMEQLEQVRNALRQACTLLGISL